MVLQKVISRLSVFVPLSHCEVYMFLLPATSMEKADADPYLWVPGNHPQTAPTLKVGEPVMQNPCSYSAVKSVLTVS